MLILIVEDEALVAMALEASLREAGHQVIGPAPSVERALQFAEKLRPELALVDIRLRGEDTGVELARELLRRGIPSLFLSGQSDEARANREAALGLLGKPYLPSTVVASVEVAKHLIEGGKPPPPKIPRGLEVFVH